MDMNINELSTEKLSTDDYQQLLEVMKASYPDWAGSYWSLSSISNLIQKFSDGQIVIKADGKVIGCALSIIVDYEKFEDEHTYRQITGNYPHTEVRH